MHINIRGSSFVLLIRYDLPINHIWFAYKSLLNKNKIFEFDFQ